MSSFSDRYEEVILQEVQGSNYTKNQKILSWVLASLFGTLATIFYFCFSKSLVRNFKFLLDFYEASLTSPSSQFRTLVFIYNHALLFMFFLNFVLCFLGILFFSYDMQRRNSIIRKLMEKK